MPRRIRVSSSVQTAIAELRAELTKCEYENTTDLRQAIRNLANVQYKLRCLSVTVAANLGLSPTAGMERIKNYLLLHAREVIDGAELETVSGISEYARRVRQLRVEEGFKIATGASPDAFSGIDLKADQYMLIETEIDTDAARRWHVANSIRKLTIPIQDRIFEFLKQNVGKVVTTEELSYVAQDRREFGSRTRQLRRERGLAIATKYNGRPDLSVGEYILQSIDRIAEEHDRHIPDALQKEVYDRDRTTCRNPRCKYQWTPVDPRILELHRIVGGAGRGTIQADKLLVMCSRCHDLVHGGQLNVLECLFTEND